MQELTDFDIAKLLSDSLKYVKLYRGHTVVVKYGGNAMKNPELQQQVMHDLVLLSMIGIRIVLVHGGGPSINKSLADLGIESKFVRGLRVTDEETMRVVQRVLAGETNKDLVKLLCTEGAKAVGLCGLDANLITARPEAEDLGLVGHITGVDVSIVETLLEKGCIPVIASVAGDGEGRSYNVNADTAAAAIAGALGARPPRADDRHQRPDARRERPRLAHFRPHDGGHRTPQGAGRHHGRHDPEDRLARFTPSNPGVERVAMINGTLPHSILVEMLTKGGIGTLVKTGPRSAASA